MTFQDMLTFSERIALMEAVSQKLRQSAREIEAGRLRAASGATRTYSDEEIKDMYGDYLAESIG